MLGLDFANPSSLNRSRASSIHHHNVRGCAVGEGVGQLAPDSDIVGDLNLIPLQSPTHLPP